MINLVDSVAEMTALRDRSAVCEAVSELLFAALDASLLEYWETGAADVEAALQLRISLPKVPADLSARRGLIHDLPDAIVAECVASKTVVRHFSEARQMHCYLFPLVGPLRVDGILRIEQKSAMEASQQKLVNSLLRIYYNHLNVLDYSELDELTGLHNRKSFDAHFASIVMAHCQWRQGPGALEPAERACWLAVLDIDHFKKINDGFGHLLGDEVLTLLARNMKACLRETDRIFRCGGEEFVLLLPGMSAAQAEKALQRLLKSVESTTFPQVGRVTVSIGATCVLERDNSPTAFGRADQALYFVKHNGRNHVRFYEDLVASRLLVPKEVAVSEVEMF